LNIEIIDVEMGKDRGSMVSRELDDLFHKFMEQVESIFKNLPKPLRWRSFLNNDLILFPRPWYGL
jgi:hypothetical protein